MDNDVNVNTLTNFKKIAFSLAKTYSHKKASHNGY